MECLLAFIEFTQFQKEVITRYRQLNGNKGRPRDSKEHQTVTNSKMELNLKKVAVIDFPENIPKSAILSEPIQFEMMMQLHGNGSDETSDSLDDMFDLKRRAHKLYHKYIKHEAEFEINVSGKQRDRVIDVVDDFSIFSTINMNHQQLLMLFNEVKQEMRMLLDFSLTRFKSSPEWNEVDVEKFMRVNPNGQN